MLAAMEDDERKPVPAAPGPARTERLAAALRANLARRKAQARGREAAACGGEGTPGDEAGREGA